MAKVITMKNLMNFKLKSASVKIMIGSFAAILLMITLSELKIFDISSQISLFLKVMAILALGVEIGVVAIAKRKGKNVDLFQWVSLTSIVILSLTLVAGLLGFSNSMLSMLEIFSLAVVVVSLAIEIIVR